MLDSLGAFGHAIMTPLYYGVSAIMVAWHWVFANLGLNPDSGWTWALSIIGLTVTIRALLIPLFVKQIKSSRNMQLLQPKIKELQKKYGHDRERLAQEQMKLWKDTGTNPFASCLPLILQMPIFWALFRTIDHAAANGHGEGFVTQDQAHSIQHATLLGARIASRFIDGGLSGGDLNVKMLTLSLVIIMCITTFMTQRQLMSKNMPKDAMSGPYAQQQKMMLYVLPFVFAVGGVAFPIGVLLYWTTSNAWTMGQQFYVIRNNPAPGTPAFRAKQERDQRHGRGVTEDPTVVAAEEEEAKPQRQQPKRQSRDQRKKQAPSKSADDAADARSESQVASSPTRSAGAKSQRATARRSDEAESADEVRPQPSRKRAAQDASTSQTRNQQRSSQKAKQTRGQTPSPSQRPQQSTQNKSTQNKSTQNKSTQNKSSRSQRKKQGAKKSRGGSPKKS